MKFIKPDSFVLILMLALIWLPCLSYGQTVSLFNGTNLDGWHMDVPDLDKNPDGTKPFIVRNGMLVSLGTPGGHLITDLEYSDYRLEVEYRFADKPGNCGVLVHASTPRALYDMFPKSLEVQMQHKHAGDFWCIVEDIKVPDMIKRRGPEDKWGIIEGKNRRIENLTDDSEKPLGEWNRMIIECRADTIEVWLNDDLVNFGYGCTANKGQIAVQAEGSEVEFRKLMLTSLKKTKTLEKEVRLITPTGTLAGSLITPEGDGPFPVALIIAGSGPTDRDGNNMMMKNNSLKFLAQDLAEQGIGSLRYDKRGVAASLSAAISEADLRFDHYVDDARAWVKELAKDGSFDEIIVVGHSEGSLIGMLASSLPEVKKYVSLAGAGQPIDRVLRKQLSSQPKNIYEESCAIMDSLLMEKQVQKVPGYLLSLFRQSVQPYLISWFKHDPAQILSKLDKPVLIIQGTTDIQVDLEESNFLKQAKPDAIQVVIENMNHVFKEAPSERQENLASYNKPDLENHPKLSASIINFILDRDLNAGGHWIWPVSSSKSAHDGYPYWSPDGKKLIYTSGTRDGSQAIIMDVASGHTDTLKLSFAQHARWSPDGEMIIYDANFGEHLEMYSLKTKVSTAINTDEIKISRSGMPCWSPSGSEIAFTADGSIYTMALPEGKPQLVFQMNNMLAIPFDWYQKDFIAAELRDQAKPQESDIYIINIKTGEHEAIIDLPGRQVKPDVTEDGKRIVFASDHGGNPDLWVSEISGSQPVRLTFFEGDLLNPGFDVEPSWSPDGKSIAFSSSRSGSWGIWIMNLNL